MFIFWPSLPRPPSLALSFALPLTWVFIFWPKTMTDETRMMMRLMLLPICFPHTQLYIMHYNIIIQ